MAPNNLQTPVQTPLQTPYTGGVATTTQLQTPAQTPLQTPKTTMPTPAPMLQFALREAITQEPALRKRISPLALAYLHDRYVRPQSEVSTAEARSFFLGNKGLVLREHVRARHIVLRKPAQCHALKNAFAMKMLLSRWPKNTPLTDKLPSGVVI